jgi:hypothetical protein
LKANKVNLFVSSVLFVFWYHSPNVLDTLHICNISWLRVKPGNQKLETFILLCSIQLIAYMMLVKFIFAFIAKRELFKHIFALINPVRWLWFEQQYDRVFPNMFVVLLWPLSENVCITERHLFSSEHLITAPEFRELF